MKEFEEHHLSELKWRDLEKRDNAWLKLIQDVADNPEKQLDLILLSITAPRSIYIYDTRAVIQKLETILRPQYGRSLKVTCFGSVFTGLAIKCSDVDLSIEFVDKNFDPKARLYEIHQILQRHDFVGVQPIDASVPVIKCESLGLSLDISFENTTGVASSQFIKYLVDLNKEVKNLIIILKFWLKKQNLTGREKLTSSVLTWLVVFYLQQKNYLNPVCNFQNSNNRKLIDGWDYSFNNFSLTFFCNRDWVLNLLNGFFNYYANFDFDSQVICPFIGKPILKSSFGQVNLLPVEYILYREYCRKDSSKALKTYKGSMCVQDPFNHSNNVSKYTFLNATQGFKTACMKGYKIIEEGNKNYERNIFFKLFN